MVGINNYFKSVANVASFGLLKTFDPKSKGHGYIQTLANDTSKVLSPIPDTYKSFIEHATKAFSVVSDTASQLGSDCIGTGRTDQKDYKNEVNRLINGAYRELNSMTNPNSFKGTNGVKELIDLYMDNSSHNHNQEPGLKAYFEVIGDNKSNRASLLEGYIKRNCSGSVLEKSLTHLTKKLSWF